jgi:DNA-binding response OmpR family regulator
VTELPLILIIEDEYLAQKDVEAALADGGFATEAVFSGEEALPLLMGGVRNYRALVTDVRLGGDLSGWDVAKRIREKEPAFPVVYLTAEAADQWASHGVPNSILITKPFAPAQLATAVSNLLNTGSPSAT